MDEYWDDDRGLYRDAEGNRVGAVMYRQERTGLDWAAIFPHRSIGRHTTEAEARAHVERAYREWIEAQEAARRR
jgi:hypothetical protein